MNANPLVIDAWRGLLALGRVQSSYLSCLLIQCLTVLLWWPKSNLSGALSTEVGPNTYLATLIALGITLGYQNLRSGCEEIIADSQQSVREWVLSTQLPLSSVLLGVLGSFLLQQFYWTLLSLPIVMVAYAGGDGNLTALTFNLLVIALFSAVCRLLGMFIYLLVGHLESLSYYLSRGAFVAGYIGLAHWFPSLAHWQVVRDSLALCPATIEQLSGVGENFLAVYAGTLTVLCGSLTLVWYLHRRQKAQSPL